MKKEDTEEEVYSSLGSEESHNSEDESSDN